MRQYQVALIHWFRRYCVKAEPDVYDVIAMNPGQMFLPFEGLTAKQKEGLGAVAENVALSKKKMPLMKHKDLLQSEKALFATQAILRNFDPKNIDTDHKILQNIYGLIEYDDNLEDKIHDDIREIGERTKKDSKLSEFEKDLISKVYDETKDPVEPWAIAQGNFLVNDELLSYNHAPLDLAHSFEATNDVGEIQDTEIGSLNPT